jgi:hypothetical protein
MSKQRLFTVLCLALALSIVPAGVALADVDTVVVIAHGPIEALGVDSLTVDGVTMTVDAETSISGPAGPLSFSDLRLGMRVLAVGTRQPDESIRASLIYVLPEPTPEPTPTPEAEDTPTPTPSPSPTPEPTAEPPACHPVALVIAMTFGESCEDIEALHDSGVGFGVIGRAFLTSLASEDQLTPQDLIEMHQAGVGWGEIMQEYGLHPGDKGLGAIMSGRLEVPTPEPEPDDGEPVGAGASAGDDERGPGKGNPRGSGGTGPGNSDTAPGQNKDKVKGKKPGR